MSDRTRIDEIRERQERARAQAALELDTDDANSAHLTKIEIEHCPLCDDDGYRGNQVCDHIDHAPAARRGMALVRLALAEAKKRRTQ